MGGRHLVEEKAGEGLRGAIEGVIFIMQRLIGEKNTGVGLRVRQDLCLVGRANGARVKIPRKEIFR